MEKLILSQNNNTDTNNTEGLENLGIYCTSEQIKYGQCKFNINKPLKIKEENPDPTPSNVVEDIVLSATFFIGTVVTVGLIISAIKLIYGFATGEDVSKYKSNVINAMIGMVLVLSAYTIVRVIQYLART